LLFYKKNRFYATIYIKKKGELMNKLDIKNFSGPHSYAKACLEEIKDKIKNRRSIDVYQILNKLDEEHLKIFYDNLISIALTDGCYGSCFFCSNDPRRTIDKQFSFESLEKFAKDFYAHNISSFQKGSLALYDDTDFLDYLELDQDGNVAKDFSDLLRIFDFEDDPVDVSLFTRLPGWSIPAFIKHAINHFIEYYSPTKEVSSLSAFKDVARLKISLHEFNKDVIDAVFINISMKIANKLNLDQDSVKEALMLAYTDLPSIDKVKNKLLVNLGRNYQEKSFQDTFLHNRCEDGIVLNPNGIHSMASIYPDKNNPTGILRLPFGNNHSYFKRASILLLDDAFDCYEDGFLVAPALDDLTDDHKVLTPDNIIKREAYRFKCLEDLIFSRGIIAFLYACYSKNDGENELRTQIEVARKLLTDNQGLDELKTGVTQLLDLIESYLPHFNNVEELTNYYFQHLCFKLKEPALAHKFAKGKISLRDPDKALALIKDNMMLKSAYFNNIKNAVNIIDKPFTLNKTL